MDLKQLGLLVFTDLMMGLIVLYIKRPLIISHLLCTMYCVPSFSIQKLKNSSLEVNTLHNKVCVIIGLRRVQPIILFFTLQNRVIASIHPGITWQITGLNNAVQMFLFLNFILDNFLFFQLDLYKLSRRIYNIHVNLLTR